MAESLLNKFIKKSLFSHQLLMIYALRNIILSEWCLTVRETECDVLSEVTKKDLCKGLGLIFLQEFNLLCFIFCV